MNTSRQEVIATLKSCLPIYQKLYGTIGYQPTEDDQKCLDKFYELFEAGLLDDETIFEEAGLEFEAYGILLGYASDVRNQTGKTPSQKD